MIVSLLTDLFTLPSLVFNSIVEFNQSKVLFFKHSYYYYFYLKSWTYELAFEQNLNVSWANLSDYTHHPVDVYPHPKTLSDSLFTLELRCKSRFPKGSEK